MINDSHCHFLSSRFLELLTADGRGADAIAAALGWEPPASVARPRGPLGVRARSTGRRARRADREHPGRRRVCRRSGVASPAGASSASSCTIRRPTMPTSGWSRVCRSSNCAACASFRPCTVTGSTTPRVERVFAAASAHRAVVFAHCGVLTVGVRKKLGLPSRFDCALGDPLALAADRAGLSARAGHHSAFRRRLSARNADGRRSVPDDPSRHVELQQLDAVPLRPDARWTCSARRLSVAGPSRLLFGTDSSFFPRGWQRPIYDGQLRILAELGVVAADRDKLFHENFDRLFPQL